MSPHAAHQRRLIPKFDRPAHSYCSTCPVDNIATGYVPGYGLPTSPILLVGESPAYDEQVFGEPFMGAAGSMLTRVNRLIGKVREQYRIDNVVRCTLPGGSLDPYPHAVAHCRYLDEGIETTLPKVVVPMGAVALRRILQLGKLKGVRVQDFHGTVQRDPSDRYWVVPTYHPSHLQRGATNLMGVMGWDLKRAWDVVAGGWPPDPGELYLDPPVEWFRAWADQYLAAVRQDPYAYPLAVDTETPEKGADEGELIATATDASYQIIRYNFSTGPNEGVTVPATPEYLGIIKEVLESAGIKYLWFKGYDVPRIVASGIALDPLLCYDGMWIWKALQSDLPMGLGFAAPFYSRWGAWKHLATTEPVKYAATDGLQTWRTVDGAIQDLVKDGRWAVFERHMHRFHAVVLQPATDVGLAIDRTRLTEFKEKLGVEASRLLTEIQSYIPPELFPETPKQGLIRPPLETDVHTKARATKKDGTPKKEAPDPVKAELFKRAAVIERIVLREVLVCRTCGKQEVAKTHRCQPNLPGVEGDVARRPVLVKEVASVRRWFWKEPFNPDSPKQLMAYVESKGYEPGKSKHTGNPSVDRDTLSKLWNKSGDPFFKANMDYRAVGKVRGTYVIGTENRLDDEDRIHGTFGFKPSTMRLNGVNPNLTNVVADKGGSTSLAAGFRHCVVARGRMVEAGSEYADG